MKSFLAIVLFALFSLVLSEIPDQTPDQTQIQAPKVPKIPHWTEKKGNDTNLYFGVDLSQPCSSTSFDCMVNNGYHFAIIRCYMSVGRVDPNCAGSVNAAWAGGMSYVDVYLFPCPTCGNGAQQVIDTVNYLRGNGVTFGMLWLDIEGTDYWMDMGSNQAFFNELVSGISATGVHAGVYTNAYQWGSIMGGWAGGAQFDLWYAHWNDDPSMSDFSPFAGWGKGAIKQYVGDTSLCGCGVDLSAY